MVRIGSSGCPLGSVHLAKQFDPPMISFFYCTANFSRLCSRCTNLYSSHSICIIFVNTEYPWGDISDHTATNFGLKKWFFLSDYLQMLDKSTLYGNGMGVYKYTQQCRASAGMFSEWKCRCHCTT